MSLKLLRPNNLNRFRRQRRAMRRRQRNGAKAARQLSPVITFLALAAVFAAQGFLKAALPREEFEGVVSRVVDGDTLHLHGVAEPLRLWGVDAPELGEAGGTRSADYLNALVKGQRLACKEMDIDRYQRIVARCLIAETGEEVNALMIDRGGAAEYVHYTGGYYLLRRLAG